MTTNQNRNGAKFGGIYRSLIAVLGEPVELHRTSPLYWCDNALEVLLATILTQATSDKNALQSWRNLKQLCKEPSDILSLDEKVLLEAIKPAGIMTRRAKTLVGVLRTIHDRFGEYTLNQLAGDPGLAREILNNLPGVGPKTAACTMLFGLGLPCFPVDTHINRIACRMGWVASKSTPANTQLLLTETIPPEYHADLHILLLNLGRRYCRPTTPDCSHCPLSGECRFGSKSS